MVIGGAAIDLTATISEPYDYSSNHRSSFPGKVVQTMGGVGRNIAEACHRSGGSPLFVSIIGNDPAGVSLLHDCSTLGIDTSLIKVVEDGGRTGIYNAIMEPNGELIKAVADMSIFERIDKNQISSAIETQEPSVICFDGNLSVPAIQSISASGRANSIPLFFEPTSVPKSKKIFQNDEIMLNETIQYASPNLEEVVVMGNCAAEVIRRYNNSTPAGQNDRKFLPDLDMSNISQHMKIPSPLINIIPSSMYLLQLIPNLFIKCGPDGVLHARYTYRPILHSQSQNPTPKIASGTSSLSYTISVSSHEFYFEWHPPSNDVVVKNVTGAGDSFVGTILTGLSLLKNKGQLNFEKQGIREGRRQVNHLGRMTVEETEQRPGNEIWRKVVGISKRSAEMTLGEERSVSLRIEKLNI
ncbi:Ribokinase-like protein [Paraphysoderma sedebokerense]|nr:Ribokinase-like protein [Paraphysoderma sedebokerense]